MGDIYFVRHAESDSRVHDEFLRPLTEKGIQDSALVTNYLKDKNIQYIYSSPYVRAVDTVKNLSEMFAIDVTCIDNFRERNISSWVEDFTTFSQQQWNDFDYKLSDGECLREVQLRNVKALMELVQLHPEANYVIGSHGTALSTIINHFNPHFGFEDFSKIKGLMPWIVKITFKNQVSIKIESIDVFKNNEITTISLSEPMLTNHVK
ncbi:MAG: histidine phosphatase family protein [Carnobacterium sp.]|uniref:histidine phosphatase family protein n=1 Tax=Carnobacterium sp. TaxID=48221 RepID=UPI00331537E6